MTVFVCFLTVVTHASKSYIFEMSEPTRLTSKSTLTKFFFYISVIVYVKTVSGIGCIRD